MVNTHSEQGYSPTGIMNLNVAAANGNDGPTASAEPPQLCYIDQTPIIRTANKKLCSQLNPLGEEQASLVQNIYLAVHDAIEKEFLKYMVN